jgi:hypothetical protein
MSDNLIEGNFEDLDLFADFAENADKEVQFLDFPGDNE